MAYAYDDAGLPISVATLGGANTFSGPITFSNTTASTSTSTGAVVISGGLGVQGNVYGSKVWGCVWNDLADCIDVPENTDLEYGYCYCFDGENYYKSTKYLDNGIIGIHSDTAGFCMGKRENEKQMNVAVAGFVLAYIDKEYPVGTPLTCKKNGILTKLKEEDISKNPHKIVGTFWKIEPNELWGPEGKEVKVNKRMWVKVR